MGQTNDRRISSTTRRSTTTTLRAAASPYRRCRLRRALQRPRLRASPTPSRIPHRRHMQRARRRVGVHSQ